MWHENPPIIKTMSAFMSTLSKYHGVFCPVMTRLGSLGTLYYDENCSLASLAES